MLTGAAVFAMVPVWNGALTFLEASMGVFGISGSGRAQVLAGHLADGVAKNIQDLGRCLPPLPIQGDIERPLRSKFNQAAFGNVRSTLDLRDQPPAQPEPDRVTKIVGRRNIVAGPAAFHCLTGFARPGP